MLIFKFYGKIRKTQKEEDHQRNIYYPYPALNIRDGMKHTPPLQCLTIALCGSL